MFDFEILADKVVRFPRAISNSEEIVNSIEDLDGWAPDFTQTVPWSEYIREELVVDGGLERSHVFSKYATALDYAQRKYAELYPGYIPEYGYDYESEIYFSRYLSGGYIDVHADIDSDNPLENRENAVSVVCYYTDKYEGGDLYFPDLGIEIKPEAGDIFIFPCLEPHGSRQATGSAKYTKYMSIHKLS